MTHVPFNQPTMIGPELEYIKDAVMRKQLAGDGYYSKKCEQTIVEFTGSQSAHLTHSCTAALEMAAILTDLKAGDEVIMPSYTFVSTANAVVLRGATPVFVDVYPETMNINPEAVHTAVTKKTKAILPVHYAGVICEMEPILEIAKDHNLMVIEDAAQAFGSLRYGKPAGSFGDMACFSFHETKNIISGEGGCLTTKSEALEMRADIIREKGTNRKAFFKGMVDKYTWVDQGSSFLPGEIIAAFLFAQLERWKDINDLRIKAWSKYFDAFADLEQQGKVVRPTIPKGAQHNGHLFYLIMPTGDMRDQFIAHMRENGVTCPFHYIPLHNSTYGKKVARQSGDMSVTEDYSRRLVRLPLYGGVSVSQDNVISHVLDFFKT